MLPSRFNGGKIFTKTWKTSAFKESFGDTPQDVRRRAPNNAISNTYDSHL